MESINNVNDATLAKLFQLSQDSTDFKKLKVLVQQIKKKDPTIGLLSTEICTITITKQQPQPKKCAKTCPTCTISTTSYFRHFNPCCSNGFIKEWQEMGQTKFYGRPLVKFDLDDASKKALALVGEEGQVPSYVNDSVGKAIFHFLNEYFK